MRNFLLFICLGFIFTSCNKSAIHHPKKVTRAFYYWQSSSSMGMNDEINRLGVKKIYYKVFEVDYDIARGNFPYNKNRPSYWDLKDNKATIIPTVFVKNEIFKHNDHKSLDRLADNICFLIDKFSKGDDYQNKNTFEYNEIQIDCDWTKSTKDKYFYLLKKIKEISKKTISCTLRLYPYAYPKIMGVPPVDKATLMCYNLIQPLTDRTKNSILDINELKKYLDKKNHYPLHLDIALPVFYWAQLYHNNNFSQLLNIQKSDLYDFTKKTDDMWYVATQDKSIGRYAYVKKGDRIKYEDVSTAKILQALTNIKKYIPLDDSVTVTLFDLEQTTFKKYNDAEIDSMYNYLSK